MSSDMRVHSASKAEFNFYRVSAKTWPFTEDKRKVIGYYSSEGVALEATRIVRENNMQRLPGGIDVFCDCFWGTQKDLSRAVYKTDIDLDERDRLLSLRFKETVVKRKMDLSALTSSSKAEPTLDHEADSSKLQKTSRAPKSSITSSFNPEIAGRNFTQGASSAQKYAQEHYGSDVRKIKITFHGTGICAMSAGPRTIDPIELQVITLMLDTDNDDDLPVYKNIGTVLPEKDHLLNLKTVSEIADEIKALIDRAFEQNPELIK